VSWKHRFNDAKAEWGTYLATCLNCAFIVDDDDLSNVDRAAIATKQLSKPVTEFEYIKARNHAIAITHMDLHSENIPDLLANYFGAELTG